MTHADNPVTFVDSSADWLGRRSAADALLRLLSGPNLLTPLAIGVYGGWGTGKTSLMKTLAAELGRSANLLLWFDAWVYARQEEALWRALLLRLIEALRETLETPGHQYEPAERSAAQHDLDQARASLYRSMTLKELSGVRVNWLGALPLVADAALSAITAGLSTHVAKALSGDEASGGLTAAITKWFKGSDTKEAFKLIERMQSEHYVEQVVSLEQFQGQFRTLLKRFGIGRKRKLFVFIDDLDRCLPEDAVAALEAVKLFLDLEGCIFLLGMDRDVVEQGIRVRYKDVGASAAFDPREYLDKIIQIPFSLPPLGSTQIRNYLDHLSQSPGQQGAVVCQDLIDAAAPANPRTLKRIVNILQLTLYLEGMDDVAIAHIETERLVLERIRRICKIILIQVIFPSTYRLLARDPQLICEAENFAERRQNKLRDDQKAVFDIPQLQTLLKLPPIFNNLIPEEINYYFTLSRATSQVPTR
jgi:hypothetical protein